MEMVTIQPIRTQQIEPKILAGLHKRYTSETMGEIPALWTEFVPFMHTMPNRVGPTDYGVVWDAWTNGPHFEYMAAAEVSTKEGLPEGLETLDIPSVNCAVFEHVGSLSKLCETIDAIYTGWLPSSGAKLAGFPGMMEVYGADFIPETMSGRIELWVPLA